MLPCISTIDIYLMDYQFIFFNGKSGNLNTKLEGHFMFCYGGTGG